MIELRDLAHVVDLARYAERTERDKEAIWALEREIVAGDVPGLETVWLMSCEPKTEV